jgi:hypothetical protein
LRNIVQSVFNSYVVQFHACANIYTYISNVITLRVSKSPVPTNMAASIALSSFQLLKCFITFLAQSIPNSCCRLHIHAVPRTPMPCSVQSPNLRSSHMLYYLRIVVKCLFSYASCCIMVFCCSGVVYAFSVMSETDDAVPPTAMRVCR